MNSRNLKQKILAATALAAFATTPAAALADAVAPTETAVIEAQQPSSTADEAVVSPDATKRWPLVAIGAAAVAGLLTLLDLRKLWRVTRKTTIRAAKASGRAAAGAVRAVARAAGAPLRFIGLVVGLVVAAFLGVGLFEIEWIGGLIIGGALALLLSAGVVKLRSFVFLLQEKASFSKSR